MPMITLEYPTGQLSAEQKTDLAGDLTRIMLEIEGGDTPLSRAGTLLRLVETPRADWFVGGVNTDAFVSASGMFVVEIHVPEGLLDQQNKTRAHKAITDAIARVAGALAQDTRSVWVQIFEWPEGALASGGQTLSLFGLARRAGHPHEHPVLTFPRAYFEAKTKAYDAHGFPDGTTGRVMNPY